MMTKYEEAVNLITSREKFHINLGLERISKILELLGNPQNNLRIIHVAGTNGKGSTCAILSKILSSAGYKTGLYTSPHIIDYTERIKINQSQISKNDFADLIFDISKLALENGIYLTEFEILTAAGFKYFSDKETDICVIETGLGGRLDATNVVSENLLSVITSISLDHTDRLGDTIEKIAFEKSGIIKQNCPVLISPKNKGFDVVSNTAKEKKSEIIKAFKNIELIFENGINFAVYNDKKYEFNLIGLWQKENLELALCAVDYLNSRGYDISENSIKKGLFNVCWDCRMQYIPKYKILIDGTHNPDGAGVLRESLDFYFPDEQRVFVYGGLITKDYEKVLKTLVRKEDEVYFFNFEHSSAVSLKDLQKVIPDGLPINQTELEYLCAENRKKIVVITGSFYMIGDILKSKEFGVFCKNINEFENK